MLDDKPFVPNLIVKTGTLLSVFKFPLNVATKVILSPVLYVPVGVVELIDSSVTVLTAAFVTFGTINKLINMIDIILIIIFLFILLSPFRLFFIIIISTAKVNI